MNRFEWWIVWMMNKSEWGKDMNDKYAWQMNKSEWGIGLNNE